MLRPLLTLGNRPPVLTIHKSGSAPGLFWAWWWKWSFVLLTRTEPRQPSPWADTTQTVQIKYKTDETCYRDYGPFWQIWIYRCGPNNENGIWQIKTNQELDKIIKRKNIINFIRAQRLSWKDARYENGKGNLLLETHIKKANRKTKDTLGGWC